MTFWFPKICEWTGRALLGWDLPLQLDWKTLQNRDAVILKQCSSPYWVFNIREKVSDVDWVVTQEGRNWRVWKWSGHTDYNVRDEKPGFLEVTYDFIDHSYDLRAAQEMREHLTMPVFD